MSLVLAAVAAALAIPVPATAAPRGHLGIFIHYGPSSLLNQSSEAQWIAGIQSPNYLKTVASFTPNPRAVSGWVSLAKEAHASYIVFVTKHHDGYTLWHSSVPVDRSAGANNVQWGASASEDVLAALASACRKAHIKLYLYYSLIDWYEHDYRVQNSEGHLAMEDAQLKELLTNYGPIAGLWLDGVWEGTKPLSFWHLDELEQAIHALQPNAKIGVNRFEPDVLPPGEGYTILEKGIPDTLEPWMVQSAWPIGGLWFYSTKDRPKRVAMLQEIVQWTIDRGFDLLLDVPPRTDGSIAPADRKALLAALDPPPLRATPS